MDDLRIKGLRLLESLPDPGKHPMKLAWVLDAGRPRLYFSSGAEWAPLDTLMNATFTSDGELFVTETERETNVRASFALTGIQASSWALLVDLSDTTNWPHDHTGAIHISLVNGQVDRSSNSVGLMQLAVVTRVDATNGDATVVASLRFENGSETHLSRDVNVAPSQIKCNVVGGVTTRMVTNVQVLNDTGLQTDVTILSARGVNTAPAVGDIVIRYVHTSGGAWTGAIGVLYHSHAEAT